MTPASRYLSVTAGVMAVPSSRTWTVPGSVTVAPESATVRLKPVAVPLTGPIAAP